jgi:acetylornithine deacetylase/succinyl-diaminopimelate desuccinylase-like protein
VSNNEQAVSELVLRKLDEIGLDAEVVGGNVIGRLEGSESSRTLALCGHLDTVAVVDPDSWTVDPYGGLLREGRLWGLGSSDMKAGLAAQIMAIDAIKRSALSLKGNILFIATVLEEVTQEKLVLRRGIIELIDKELIDADVTIIGEPTDLFVARGHKGVCNIDLTTHGKSAHASVSESGINAIEKMAKILLAIKTIKLAKHSELGLGTLTTCIIEGGVKTGIVPDVPCSNRQKANCRRNRSDYQDRH